MAKGSLTSGVVLWNCYAKTPLAWAFERSPQSQVRQLFSGRWSLLGHFWCNLKTYIRGFHCQFFTVSQYPLSTCTFSKRCTVSKQYTWQACLNVPSSYFCRNPYLGSTLGKHVQFRSRTSAENCFMSCIFTIAEAVLNFQSSSHNLRHEISFCESRSGDALNYWLHIGSKTRSEISRLEYYAWKSICICAA